ncbi:MarR family winged helix-turn-helix transcriptional regulator [Streptomyces phaeoluteigriseus]|uniref:MarR family winged helix-turn-helix transcriptional regulator n=1 Tax=Streptomyces phaeoluteigriseus TaxID=114686 RepID=A0ABY4Z5Q2_9ACTN|nr:MarR family winged helix-turn-helix transcriptional regulator [Streptomyces phaeoluteigriseus]USQ84388.1 MarR family winged helix-turn-helix transcriptional regulator [Streptomyces phaeoluteigriseus]
MVRDRDPHPPPLELRHPGPLLGRAQSRLTGITTETLVSHGVDGREPAGLAVPADGAELSQADATARPGVDRTTMVSLTDGPEDHGLVERRPSPYDRRRNVVALTAPGEECLLQAERARRAAEHRFLAPPSEEAATALLPALRTPAAEEDPATGRPSLSAHAG